MANSPITIIPSIAWAEDLQNPTFAPGRGYNSFRGDATGGVDISSLGFTKVTNWGNGIIETIANNSGMKLQGTTSVAYIRNDEYNRGRIAGQVFKWTTGLANNTDVLVVGRKVTKNGSNQLSGFFGILKHLTDTSFQVRIERWDDNVIGATSTPVNVTIPQDTLTVLYIATNTYNSIYTKTPFAQVYPLTNYYANSTYNVKASFATSDFDTYSGTYTNGELNKTLLGILDPTITTIHFENGPDSWYKAFVNVVCINGEHDNVWRDSQGRAHAVYQTGDAESLDQSSWLTTESNQPPRFFDGCQTYKGVRGRLGAVLRAAEKENGSWSNGQTNLMGKNQTAFVFADVEANEFKAYYTSDSGAEDYRLFFATCTLTSDPSNPDNWTYQGSITTNVYNVQVLKKDVLYNGTQYHYIALFLYGGGSVYLAFSVDGRLSWTVGPSIITGVGGSNQLGFDTVQNKWWALISNSNGTGRGKNNLYTAPNGANNLPGTWTLTSSNIGPGTGSIAGDWDYNWRWDGRVVEDGNAWFWHYAGTGDALIPGDSVPAPAWLNLTTGVATYNLENYMPPNPALETNIIFNKFLNSSLNSAKITYSNIILSIYSDAQCTIQDATLGQLTAGQINIVDRYIQNNTSIPVSVLLYDASETLGKVTYSWDGVTYADPTVYFTINPDEIQNFKVKVDLTATSQAQSFSIGKKVKGVV